MSSLLVSEVFLNMGGSTDGILSKRDSQKNKPKPLLGAPFGSYTACRKPPMDGSDKSASWRSYVKIPTIRSNSSLIICGTHGRSELRLSQRSSTGR